MPDGGFSGSVLLEAILKGVARDWITEPCRL